MEPLCLKLVPQRHSHDCVIACLASLLGTSYEATLIAFTQKNPDAGAKRGGLYWTDAQRAAKALGFKLVHYRGTDRESQTGMMAVEPREKGKSYHAVLHLRGVIVDPADCSIWDDLGLYCEVNGFTPGSMLIPR